MNRVFTIVIGILISTFPNISYGCAVCYGDPQAPMTAGLNQAIFFLLGVIGFILSIVLSVGIYFFRRGKTINKAGING